MKQEIKPLINYFDFEKNSWEKIHQALMHETGSMAHIEISNILFATIKQHMIDSRYPTPKENGNPFIDDPIIKKLVFETINYTRNTNNRLKDQPIWTGNFYQTNIKGESRKYALIITPECDFAQEKNIFYKVVFGFEINDITFSPDYDHSTYDEKDPLQIFPFRAGKLKNGSEIVWGLKKVLQNNYINKNTSPNQYLYSLPHISKNLIYIDFRDVKSHERVDLENWTLLLRINEPMITDILDKYSNLHNRKGLVTF